MRPDFIDDSYNEPFTIEAVSDGGITHGALTGTFRPCVGVDRETALDLSADDKPLAVFFGFAAMTLPKYIVSWDLKDRHGVAVKCDDKAIQQLNPRLRDRLASIVFFNALTGVEDKLKN